MAALNQRRMVAVLAFLKQNPAQAHTTLQVATACGCYCNEAVDALFALVATGTVTMERGTQTMRYRDGLAWRLSLSLSPARDPTDKN